MAVLPRKPGERVAFFQNRQTLWNTNATQIGLTTAEVTALGTKATAAAAAIAAAEVARDNAKSATQAADNAVEAMTLMGAEMIKKIKVKAGEAGDNVYTLSNVPAPALPSPVGAPGMPFALKPTLKASGAVEMTWKANNPAGCSGVIWQIYRKTESTGEYMYLGGTGSRKFTDTTVPAGVPSVMYQIQGTRSTAVGDAAEFVVNFGVSSGGGMTTATAKAASTGTPAKIAA
jgi:hypothetical protein